MLHLLESDQLCDQPLANAASHSAIVARPETATDTHHPATPFPLFTMKFLEATFVDAAADIVR